jgi:hypothetical protein
MFSVWHGDPMGKWRVGLQIPCSVIDSRTFRSRFYTRCCWFLAWLVLRLWRWRLHVASKHRLMISAVLHNTAVATSNATRIEIVTRTEKLNLFSEPRLKLRTLFQLGARVILGATYIFRTFFIVFEDLCISQRAKFYASYQTLDRWKEWKTKKPTRTCFSSLLTPV